MEKIVFIFFVFSFLSFSSNACVHTNNSFKCVRYLSNYDGDTVRFNIPNVHPFIGEKISVRINGVDTPELRGKGPCEKILAKKAKYFIQLELLKARRIDLINISKGKYFRIVADIIVDGESLGKKLLDKKMAYPYDGGKKNSNLDWCQYESQR